MHGDYLVFWHYVGTSFLGHADVARIHYPPHDTPHGSILEGLVREDILQRYGATASTPMLVTGIIELPPALWSGESSRELAVGNGRVGSLERTHSGWQVHI